MSIRSAARSGQLDRVTAYYLHTNEGSDPVRLETLGIKSDQSRGSNNPGVVSVPKVSDDSRFKRLAQHVLATATGGAIKLAA